MGETGARALVSALDNNSVTRGRIEFALGQMGEMGAAVLATALTDADPIIRGVAAEALGRLRSDDPTHVVAIGSLLDDPHPEVQACAARALERRGEAGAIVLGGHLGHMHGPSRSLAAESLG